MNTKVSRLRTLLEQMRPSSHLSVGATEAERGRGRMLRAVWAMAASSGARAVSMATGFIAVPLTLHYLGGERNGVLATITSLSLALNFADLGLGNSLLTTIAAASGRGDRAAERRNVSTATFLFLGLALMLFAGFALIHPHVNWPAYFNVKTPVAAAEIGSAVWWYVLWFAGGLAVSVVARVELAHQNGFANGVWQAAASVASLIALVVAVRMHAGLAAFVFAMSGVPVLAALAQSVVVFGASRPWLRPAWASVDRRIAIDLLRLGSGYVIVQAASAVSLYADNFVATQVLGPVSVNQYTIVSKPFVLVSTVLFMAFVPMWPAITEALANADVRWVRRNVRRMIGLVLLAAGSVGVLMMTAGPALIRAWVKMPGFEVPRHLLFALAAITLVQALCSVCATLLNAMRVVRFQAICAVVTSAAALAAKIWGAKWFGLPGLVWGTTISIALFTLLPSVLYIRIQLRERLRSQPRPGAA